jgi:hypothetical protein
MSLQVVIFSKDRPMQLHATLASLMLHCQDLPDINVGVLYYASSKKFAQGYQELQIDFSSLPGLSWVGERDFKQDLLRLVLGDHWGGSGSPDLRVHGLRSSGRRITRFILFLVDDTLFTRSFSFAAIASSLARCPRALAFSLRLGMNTTFCYSRSSPQQLPRFVATRNRSLQFRWLGAEGDFGYPLEVSSSVFRVDDLLPLLRILPYSNPNRLEQRLAASRLVFSLCHPDLLCFERSVAFCAPLNKVQTVLPNRSGDSNGYSSDGLHFLFEQGLRIDVKTLTGFEPHAAHQEIDLPFTAAPGL